MLAPCISSLRTCQDPAPSPWHVILPLFVGPSPNIQNSALSSISGRISFRGNENKRNEVAWGLARPHTLRLDLISILTWGPGGALEGKEGAVFPSVCLSEACVCVCVCVLHHSQALTWSSGRLLDAVMNSPPQHLTSASSGTSLGPLDACGRNRSP